MRATLFLALALCAGSVCAQGNGAPKKDYAKLANYDESKVPQYTLPDVLLCRDGEVVTTKEQWEKKRRPEVLEMFTTYMFGKVPPPLRKQNCVTRLIVSMKTP